MSDPKTTSAQSYIRLPSRGVLYGGLIPDGKIAIRKLLVPEIAMLESQGMGGVDRISNIIKVCSTLPQPGITHQNLLITDRMAILLALRTFTFGPLYNFQFKCQFCNTVGKGVVNISQDLEEKVAEEDLKEPIEIILPDADKIIAARFLRGEDEERVAKYTKRMKLQSNDAGDPSNIHRLALQIVNVNGEEMELRRREDFVRGLTAADQVRFQNAIDKVEPGLDLKVLPDCRNCGATNELSMPFTGEFFRPTNL